MSDSYAVTNVRAVLSDHVLDSATVVVTDGIIETVTTARPTPPGAVDGHGMLLLPGLVDSHSDGLEKEISPRRAVAFPVEYALASFEGRVRAAGVTTVFHGLAYQDVPRLGRSVEHARAIYDSVATRRSEPTAAVDHRVLYRFEARDETAVDPLLDDLDRSRTMGLDAALVSFEDHTPGQGQYRDPAQMVAAVDPTGLPPGLSAEDYVANLMAEAEALADVRDKNLARLAPLARRREIRLLAHDAETPDDVAAAHGAGAAVAEFPITREAAAEARQRAMPIVLGAPNALRGRSHSGNASARELVAAGLCDALASDYMPSALLSSVFAMAAEGCCTLPRAVQLITSGPAAMAGLADRGRIEAGARGDLALVDDRSAWPQVVGVRRAGDHHVTRIFG